MYKHILIPLDMEQSALNARAIEVAEDLATHHGASITALSAIPNFSGNPMVASYFPDDAGEQAYKDACREFRQLIDAGFKNPKAVTCTIVVGSARKEIVRYIKKEAVDLVVMPARKNDIGKVLLGSNSSYVADRAPCSVLIVRP